MMVQSFDEFDTPMQGPFEAPVEHPLSDPLRDPLYGQLKALEDSIQPASLPGEVHSADLAEGMDCLGYILGQLELGVEVPTTSFPPPNSTEPSVPAPLAAPLGRSRAQDRQPSVAITTATGAFVVPRAALGRLAAFTPCHSVLHPRWSETAHVSRAWRGRNRHSQH